MQGIKIDFKFKSVILNTVQVQVQVMFEIRNFDLSFVELQNYHFQQRFGSSCQHKIVGQIEDWRLKSFKKAYRVVVT